MPATFYAAAVVAVAATALAISRKNAVHGLLYLIVSLLAVALMFFAVGAEFVAALEVIIYAGAIMVLFVFVMMLLNLGPQSVAQERRWLPRRIWAGPLVLTAVLIAELIYGLASAGPTPAGAAIATAIDPLHVGVALFGPYAAAVEIASMLLLAGLIGAYHLGRSPGERS
ncbi:MAG TPA: NADH-quinone oxidoreductase subunit J [Vicinamibacterales bacterium]|nr:NADH-quinone oxidoreductase subunit J [Vicinamibacterales bacterium]